MNPNQKKLNKLPSLIYVVIIFMSVSCLPLEKDGGKDILSPQERQWLTEHKEQIRYAPSPNYPPIGYVDQAGSHKGITADYIEHIEKRLNFRFKMVYCSSWAEIIEKAKNKEIDVVGNIQDTLQRREYLQFTTPYVSIPNAIIVRKDVKGPLTLAELVGMKVAVVKGYATIGFLKKEQPDLIIETVKDTPSGLQSISFGGADAMITDLAVASHYIDQLGITNLRVAGIIDFKWDLAFGSRKDWPILNTILNKALAEITVKERKRIYHRWIKLDAPSAIKKEVLNAIFLASGGIVLLICFVLFWNRKLQKEIEERKKVELELQKSHAELKKTESLLTARFQLSELAIHASLETLMQATIDEAEKITGSNIGFFHFVAEDQESLILQAWSTNTLATMCTAVAKGKHYPVSQAGVWADCFYQRAPVIHQDYSSLPYKKGIPEGHAPVSCELTVPIIQGDKVKAIIGVGNKSAPYTEEDIKVVKELASFSFDLIERKLAEEAMQKAALEWATAMDASDDAIYLLDTKRHILRANKVFFRMTGSSPKTAIGEHIEKIVHPEGEVVPCPVCRAQEELRNEVIVMEPDHPDNPTGRPIEITVTIVKSEEEKPISIFMRLHDLTGQRKIENTLRKSKEEWENTFNAMNEIITILDKDMRIVKANKTAHNAFNVEFGDLNGRYCYEVFRDADHPCPNCPEKLTIEDAIPHSAVIKHENLGKIFQVTSSPILDENGDFTHVVHIAKDITEQKKLEEELFQAHKMEAIGTLAGGIAHDFNNILAAILGYADMAMDEIQEESPSKNYIVQVLKAGNRAKELVQQILTFSRKRQETNQPLRPFLIIKEALKFIRASMPTTIEIHEQIDPNCGLIIANPTNIHQVFVNLCTNALQAMEDEKGVLTVKLTRLELSAEKAVPYGVPGGMFVELMVKDTGCGMDKRTIERIFEPYFTTKGVGKGSGMGLALVHGIVKDYGGFIRVESELNKGTTFHVYFPAIKKAAMEIEEEKQMEPLPRGSERILLVDDEEVIVGMYQTALEKLGYKVTAHCSSIKTLRDFQASPGSFDLVITDQTMPELSGLELAKKILHIRPNIPIILCTGYSSRISKENAEKIGIKSFLMKPLSRNDLAATVREILDKW